MLEFRLKNYHVWPRPHFRPNPHQLHAPMRGQRGLHLNVNAKHPRVK